MHIEIDELKAVGMVINEKGFHIIEARIHKMVSGMNSLERISGDSFEDGVLKGLVSGQKAVLHLFDDLRKALKELKEGEHDR